MPTKPETILKKIGSLPDHQSKLCLSFKEWLEYENDNSERNWINYFKILNLFADHIGDKKFADVKREDILSFLDQRKKNLESDPEKKWIVTWNGYLSRLLGFYRWLHNYDKNKDRDNWTTPEIFASIKRKKNKRISSYSPTDVWSIDELLTVVKYCTNLRDKAILTISWDMAARNHEMVKLKLKKNDLLFTIAGTLGKICKISEKDIPSNTNQAISIIRINNVNYSPEFFKYYLNSDSIKKQINIDRTTSAQPNLSLTQVENFLIPDMSLSEQQKIALILSTVDDLINKYDELIQSTTNLKKGLLQKLLTRGIGHKNFKKVKSLFGKYEEIPNDWEFQKLEDVGEIIGGGTPESNQEEFWNGDVLWAVPTDITKQSSKFIDNTERKISKQGLKESSAKLLPEGTLLITSRATIGECSINIKPISTNQGFQNLICNEENFNEFWYYAIKYHKKRLLRLSYGTTFLEISKNGIKHVSIPSPKSKVEQQKIASILSNIDSKIQKQQEYKSKLETLKKGLMQKLLTGQIRVKVYQIQ